MKKLLLATSLLTLSLSILPAQSRLHFDGFGDYVQLGGTDFPPPWTAEVLVYKNQQSPYSHLLTGTDGTSGLRLEQYINNNRVGVTKAGIADWTFNYQVPAGEWKHLAFVCDGSTIKLYVNGVLTGGTINGTINMPMDKIGLNTTGAGALNAQIDELRIWNTALPEASIQAYLFDTIPAGHPQHDNLVSYYRFDEGAGTTAFDSKGDLDGTIYGATYTPVRQRDVAVAALVRPLPFVNNFSVSENITIRIANNGLQAIEEDFEVGYSLNGGPAMTATVEASTSPLPPYTSVEVNFPPVDLSFYGTHTFELFTALPGDELSANDTLVQSVSETQVTIGDITGFQEEADGFLFSSFTSKVKVSFYRDDIFRIQLAPSGQFFDPADGQIVVHQGSPISGVEWADEGDYYKMESQAVVLRAYKSPLKFALYEKDNETLIWEEIQPLSFGQESRQRIRRNPDEHFYGCGMQNGYFSHRDRTVPIENIYADWGDGAVPNPAPFYLSTSGYGALRNTFSRGEYRFQTTVSTLHRENHFDCYYFYGPSLKEVLEGYTFITGRPFMMPRWGMEFGDADCYNNTGTTADVISQVAQVYRNLDMPGGWILPNDGYGCGYENLEFVVEELHNLGFYTGLWTEDGVGNIDYEVGTAGTRCVKLDVALVGPGYASAMQSGKAAFGGIEAYSNDRGYVWTVAGWAGTQRFATIWSGDQYGTWENIRFHIPTVIGSGLSGFNAATGDIDGIFGGSAPTYTRDLQWKCFTPAMMTISGWAPQGKQPWAFGEPYTSYNRKFLNLKMQLTPYLYSYSWEAHQTGVPTARAMVLEFPDDPTTWDNTTQYQFMSGEWLLVAPMYQPGLLRNGIYLPEGDWIDYWDGTRYQGPMTLDAYPAPLDKMPLFVRAGAIIPMYPEGLYDRAVPKDTLIVDLYPEGQSRFRLYEDDGHSQAYRDGAYVTTEIDVVEEESSIHIDAIPTAGSYEGQPEDRVYLFQVRYPKKPGRVEWRQEADLPEFSNREDWETNAAGWYYDAGEKGGTIFIKTEPVPIAPDNGAILDLYGLAVVEVEEPAGIGKLRISLFPNPASHTVTLSVDGPAKLQAVNVFREDGRQVEVESSSQSSGQWQLRFPLEFRGLAFVEAVLEDGRRVVERVVVR